MEIINLFRIPLMIAFFSIFCAQSTAQGITCGFEELSSIETTNQPTDALFDGQIMTLISFNVVTKFDLSDPSEPLLLEEFTLPRTLSSIIFTKNLVMGFQTGRLYIYDISDRNAPVELSARWVGTRIYDLAVLGNYAYVSVEFTGIKVFDISDPTEPVEVTILSPEPDGLNLQIKDTTLWATSEILGLVSYDLSNPASPIKIDSQPIVLESQISSFTFQGDIIYATEYGPSLISIDISDPTSPQVLDRIEFDDRYLVLGFMDDWIYTTNHDDRVQLVDRRDPSNLSLAMSYRFEETIDFYAVGAGAVIVYERGDSTRLYSPAGENPIMDSTPISPALFDYHVDEPYMYQLYMDELRILERNELGEFIQIATYTNDSEMWDIEVGGNTAYIALASEGILILDISDPTTPQLITTYQSSTYAYKIQLFDDLLYYSDSSGELWTVDISNPEAPLTVRRLVETHDPKNIEVVGGYAYVPDGRQGLKIFDVSDQWNPTFVGRFFTTFDAYDVAVRGQIAYLVHSFRISVIDISDPTNPTLLNEIYPFGRVYEILHHNDILYVRNDDWKVLAYSLEDPTLPTLQAELERYTRLSRVGDSLFAVENNASPTNGIAEINISNACASCPADYTGDGVLDFFDISTFLQFFGNHNPAADLTNDGIFNFFDISSFLQSYHAGCP